MKKSTKIISAVLASLMLVALAAARGDGPPTPSVHRLRLGLPGYLILFAPPAFAPQRRSRPRGPPSPPVFHPISAHSTATPGVPPSPTGPKPRRFRGLRGVEPPASTPGLPGRLRALYAQ